MDAPVTVATPGAIGSVVVRNRIVMAPMLVNLAHEGGEVSAQMVEFYRRRAAGGVGLLLTECTYVVAKGGVATRGLAIYDDRFLPGLAGLCDAVKGEGAAVGIQLFFNGAGRGFASDDTVSVGPSDLRAIGGPAMHPLTRAEIGRIRDAFADAAGRAVRAGFDAVELHMVHGHLLGRFVSPYFNRRQDGYGGTVGRRLRLPLEIIEQVKSDHPGLALLTRISVDERLVGGIHPPLATDIARRLLAGGADAVHLSVGNGVSEEGLRAVFPSSYQPEAPFLTEHRQLLAAVQGTVVVAGGVRSAAAADRVLRAGADFVSVGRGLIADPDLPAKWTGRDPSALRPCVGTNQGCVDALVTKRAVRCTVNPDVGREQTAAPQQARSALRVSVVGGGPAGMNAALSAARAGHRVQLLERSDRLGGQLVTLTGLPGREAFAEYVRWATAMINSDPRIDVRLGVDVRDPSDVASADVIVRATGGRHVRSELVQHFETPTSTPDVALRGGLPATSGRAVVYGGGMIANAVALWLAGASALSPVLLSLSPAQVPDVVSTAPERRASLRAAGVDTWSVADVSEEARGVLRLTTEDGRRTTLTDVEVVIDTSLIVPVDLPAVDALVAVGDANEPGTALEAIRQGSVVGNALSGLLAARPRRPPLSA